jgi:hypothetical protein
MLSLRTDFHGLKKAEAYVENIGAAYPSAARRGLTRIIRLLYGAALNNLSGPGGAGRKAQIVGPARGFTKKSGESVNFKAQFSGAGAYPVPVRTGNLRRLLAFVSPGQTVSAGPFTIHAGSMEAILFNSAEYANVIHEGTGSSAKFGPRRYLIDALNKYKNGEMSAIMAEEMARKVTP